MATRCTECGQGKSPDDEFALCTECLERALPPERFASRDQIDAANAELAQAEDNRLFGRDTGW